jgi:cytochrome c oxidase cbb3-type subunit III
MGERNKNSSITAPRRKIRWRGAAFALSLLAIAGTYWFSEHGAAERLVRADPTQILLDPALLQRAVDLGRPLYQKHCATCHGVALQGNPARGVPNLAKNAWLYPSDPVAVEHTILYGIRSGHPKAHNVTDMPALVRSGQISAGDARDVVELLVSFAGAPHDSERAERGRTVYFGKGNCFDCHAADARGVTDYGAPALTGPVWLYGGDRAALYQSVLNGRHGICPAWIGQLNPLQIRSLTLYVVSASRIAPAITRH